MPKRKLRDNIERDLKNQDIIQVSVSTAHPNQLKIGSINVNGLDLQTDAALRDLLSARF